MVTQPLSGKKIFIVEDEVMIVVMLEDMLDELGCQVAGVAAKPTDALAMIGQAPIDAAILDLNLNGHDSYAIADALKERDIPFLFSTGYTAVMVDDRFRDRPFLQKPFRQEDLETVLATLLNGKDATAS